MFAVALLRHPPVRAAGLCYGRLEVPLAPGWENSLPRWAGYARPMAPRLIRSSPRARCLLPAQALAGRLGVAVRIDPRLAELDFGDWEGLCWDAVPRHGLDRWAADPHGFAAPGGETGAALISRVASVRDTLLEERVPQVLVSHGGPLRLLGPMLRGARPDLLARSPEQGMMEILAIG